MSRVRRSMLAMPVNVRRFVEGAARRNADAIILNLEDPVAPEGRAHARTLVREALSLVTEDGAEAWVRVNRDSVEDDCEASVWPGLTGIILPSAESPEDVAHADRLLARLEAERGIPVGTTRIAATVETARGVRNAHAIAAASPRIATAGVVGETGLAADLGLPMDAPWDAGAMAYHRGEADLAARALGLSIEGHRSAVVVHPSQVDAANRAFTPQTEQVQEALAVVFAFEEADRNGEAYGVHRGRIVDGRVAAAARALLVYAEECAAKDADMQRAMAQPRPPGVPEEGQEGQEGQAQAPDSEGDVPQPELEPPPAEGETPQHG